MISIDPQALKPLATRYIWWQTPDEAVATPQRFLAALPSMASATFLQDERNALTALVPCGNPEKTHVKVSFFGAIYFGRLAQPDITDDCVLQAASLEDLMATKVKVVPQRAQAKDYRDIAAMLRLVLA